MAKEHKPDVARPEYLRERTRFRALLVGNPNYFGNLVESPFKPILKITGNTTYEEIGCVGFHPQHERLEAVVYVKQPFGYGGDVCQPGTPEYVRFFISFDGGATWSDQGMESFTAHDIPEGTEGAKRLEYDLSRTINPPNRLCLFENVAKVRAILSWNAPVPPDPNFVPIWGDVHDTWINIDGRKLFPFGDLVAELDLQIPPEIAELIDPAGPVTTVAPKELSLPELAQLYKGTDVETHRFALPELHKLVNQPAISTNLTAGLGLGLDFGDLAEILFPTDGNTSYEELECVGFNPTLNVLAGVIRLKKASGYSGGPCTAGSREYVTFWADTNTNGTFETCLGTAMVTVHDISTMPKEGLELSVFLPMDVSKLRRPCAEGPVVVPIRAILSWQVAPPCFNPNYVPVWGNREETLIEIPAGRRPLPGEFLPYLYSVCNVASCSIDPVTGLATGDRPFGAGLNIEGEIPAALALGTDDTLKYQVSVRPLDPVPGVWQRLTNSFGVTVTGGVGFWASSSPLTQDVDGDDFYTYREYGTPPGPWRRVTSPNRTLAVWNSAPNEGRWEIMVIAKDTLTNIVYAAGTVECVVDGSTRTNIVVRLDQKVPVVALAITGFSENGGPVQPAIDCATFVQGMTVHGTYSVADEHFGTLTLTVEPAASANGATVVPPQRVYGAPDFVPTTGEAGTWSLDTTGMDPCGYTVRLHAWDRTIVGCGGPWRDEVFVGFCLDAPAD